MKNRNNKKILYAASNMTHINNFHLDYIKALREEGYDVTVMARGEGADIDMPFEKKLFSPKNTACRRRIRKIIKDGGFDAIILHTSLAAFHIRFACPARHRPKIINVVHGYLFSPDVNPIKSKLLLLCEMITRGKTDAIITMNEADYKTAVKHKLARGEIYRSRGMGACVREEITPTESIRREYFSESSFTLTFVGELSKRKNQGFLITAMKDIQKQIPGAKLCLVGDGAMRTELEELAKSTLPEGSVIFTGSRKDACDFISASDLYVSASSIEGMPFNLIEAMGKGKTLLVSRIKGHEDLISEGVDGYLYKFGDLKEFVDRVVDIYQNGKFIPEEKAVSKYLKYEKSSVFPETLSIMKDAMK